MNANEQGLLGSWQRIGQSACAAGYAAHLRFEANGLYRGENEPAGAFTWWDGGTWHVPEPGQLALSTANDAIVLYSYRLDQHELSILDPAGCRFSYRRSP